MALLNCDQMSARMDIPADEQQYSIVDEQVVCWKFCLSLWLLLLIAFRLAMD